MLAPPPRTPSGYRDYDDAAVDRLGFVRAAQSVGLTLGEIREIVALRDRGETPCRHVTELLDRRRNLHEMKRLLIGAASVYVLFAIIGRFVEGMGAVQCGCAPDCWCHRPLLSTFRWVFPYGHRSTDPGGSAAAAST